MTTTPNLGLTQYAGTDTMNFLTQYNTDLDKIDDYSVATNTNIGTLASLKTAVKTSTVGAINEVYDTTDNGWISARATLTYSSADAPTFVCNTSIDLTTRISVGMKIKLTQTTTKYFFVTAITPTTITLYGGTDYVVANATISNVYYSMVKSPLGFPMNPTKWSVEFLKETNTIVGNTIGRNWYQTTDKLSIPIGSWNIYAKYAYFGSTPDPTYGSWVYTTLSANINSSTNPKFNHQIFGTNTGGYVYGILALEETILLTVNTTFTVLLRTMAAGTGVGTGGNDVPTIIRATCAYL